MSWSVQCPGSSTRNLTADIVFCPACGNEVEIFSDETRRRCSACRKMVYRERLPSCVDWCPSARECLGEERWRKWQEEIKG